MTASRCCFGQSAETDGEEKKDGKQDQKAEGDSRLSFKLVMFPEKK